MSDNKKDNAYIYCLRTMLQNNMQLILLADRKAGVVLGTSFLMISILITQFLMKGWLLINVIPLIFCLMISASSILALSPRVDQSQFKSKNIFFFSNICVLTEEQFIESMRHILDDPDLIINSMLIDCHQTSKILAAKYKQLKLCYSTCFVFITVLMLYVTIYFAFWT